jgi:hypothetical protein
MGVNDPVGWGRVAASGGLHPRARPGGRTVVRQGAACQSLPAGPTVDVRGWEPASPIGVDMLLDHDINTTRTPASLGVREVAGWRLKVYAIAGDGSDVRESLLPAALAVAELFLPGPAVSCDTHGVGAITIQDEGAVAGVFLDYWSRDGELHRQRFLSLRALPAQLRPLSDDGPTGCVWNLAVLDHERIAFVRHVFGRDGEPDLDGYLADVFGGDA